MLLSHLAQDNSLHFVILNRFLISKTEITPVTDDLVAKNTNCHHSASDYQILGEESVLFARCWVAWPMIVHGNQSDRTGLGSTQYDLADRRLSLGHIAFANVHYIQDSIAAVQKHDLEHVVSQVAYKRHQVICHIRSGADGAFQCSLFAHHSPPNSAAALIRAILAVLSPLTCCKSAGSHTLIARTS